MKATKERYTFHRETRSLWRRIGAIAFVCALSFSWFVWVGCSETPENSDYVFKPATLNGAHITSDASLVDCTLENGTQTKCYRVSFKSNPLGDGGPYCPKTDKDVGGLGIYDGDTNPGLQALTKTLWDAMAADGFSVLDADGNVKIVDPSSGGRPDGAACLEASPNHNLTLTFTIPASPVMLNTPNQIGSVELVGMSLNGIPINGQPPTVAGDGGGRPGGGGALPSLDPCGGHMDPAGYYHWHFGAAEMNAVLKAKGITEVTCEAVVQSTTVMLGYAKDGHPMYASKDMDGSEPSDLDACRGHTSATKEYPDGVYHYHVSTTEAPNLPPCLKGAAARNPFQR